MKTMLIDCFAFLRSGKKGSSCANHAGFSKALIAVLLAVSLFNETRADETDLTSLPTYKVQVVQRNPNGDTYQIGDRITLYVEIPQDQQNQNSSFGVTVPESGSKLEEQGWYLDPQTNFISGNLRFTVSPIQMGTETLPMLLILDHDKKPIARTDPWTIKVTGQNLAPGQDQAKPQYLPLATVSLAPRIWIMLFLGLLLAIALAAFGYYKWKHKKQAVISKTPPPVIAEQNHVIALRALADLYQKNPYSLEKLKPVAFGISEVMKHYFSREFRIDATESTTQEMLKLLKDVPVSFTELKEIDLLFKDLDLIKFTKSENYLRFNETDYLGFRARAERVIHQWTHPEPSINLPESGGSK